MTARTRDRRPQQAANREQLYLRLRDELTAQARTSAEYEEACREAARRAGV